MKKVYFTSRIKDGVLVFSDAWSSENPPPSSMLTGEKIIHGPYDTFEEADQAKKTLTPLQTAKTAN